MASEWDGTAWAGSVVAPPLRAAPISGPAEVIAKAEAGGFVGNLISNPYLAARQQSPQKMMRAAQQAYHRNPWIGAAEATVTRRVAALPWHLEDDQDEEYEEPYAGPVRVAVDLLQRPQAALPVELRDPALLSWRSLISITSRHLGLCGMAYWYPDQPDANGIPLAILYVNPARVWAACTDAGRIIGWVVDAKDEQGHGGTPYKLGELIPFYLDPPDFGYYGTGLYQRALLKAQITTTADQHALYVLGTGGRIPGILSPKEGTIPDETYKTLVAEFRNVNEAPDAAKRTTILRGPIDFTKTAADPSELALADLAKMNRDDIFATWGVPPTQAGVPLPAGLNSGPTKEYDEAILMQGAVHDRVRAIVETVQYGLLDRWQAIGTTIDLEIEEPEFDDRTPQFENAQRAVAQPMTNLERRDLLGLAPFGDDRDEEVWLPATSVLAYGAGGSVPTPPAPPTVTKPEMEPEMEPGMTEMPAKAARREFLGLRRSVDTRWVPRVRASVADLLASQRKDAAAKVRAASPDTIARQRKNPNAWFALAKEAERLNAVLRPLAAGIAETVAERTSELLKDQRAKADAFTDQVVAAVARKVGSRVTEISRTTQDAIAAAVAQGYDDGLSPSQIGDLIENLPAFDEARAELVARTETMFAYNDAALTSYGEYGVTDVVAYDGDQDEACAARDGQTYPVADAFDIQDHPNGTLDWAPVLKAVTEAKGLDVKTDEYLELKARLDALSTPTVRFDLGERQPPVVNVEASPAPIVTIPPFPAIPAPIVNVDMTPVAAMLAELKTELRRPVTRVPQRDSEGRILRVVETYE